MKKLYCVCASLLVIASCLCHGQTREEKHIMTEAPVPTVGSSYVDIAGPDAVSGKTISIKSAVAKGKPVIVDFWASWCPPCRRAISGELIPAAKKYKDKLTILGIAVWENSVEDTRKAMTDLGVSWPVLFGGGRKDDTAKVYGVTSIPTMVGIDKDGKIVAISHDGSEVLEALGLPLE